MSPSISERSLEEAIECGLLEHGPDACARRRDRLQRAAAAALRRRGLGLLSQAPARGLRSRALPHSARRDRLHPRDPAEGVGEAEAAPRRSGARAVPEPPCIRNRAARRARRAAQRPQGLRRQVPARLLPAGERAQRGDQPALPGEPVRRRAPAPLQREEREQSRPRAVPERHSDLHRGAEEPADRPGRRGRHPPVQDRPRPARAALRLRPLPRPFRRGSGPRLRDDAPRRAEDALPAVQPGQVRRRRQSRPSRRRRRATPRLTCGRRPGRATACSTSCVSSSTKWKRRTTRAARPASDT